MPKTLTYLASPYTHENHEVEEARFREVCRAGSHFISHGLIVFVPIAMSHPIREACPDVGGDWETWSHQDYAFLDCSKQVYVLTLDGWQDSVGVTAEIQYAWKEGIPVYLVDSLTYEVKKDEYLPENSRDD